MHRTDDPSDRRMSQPPVFRAGFRPFFLLGATWAIIVLALWIAALAGLVRIPSLFDALAWHRHEMLFGFLGAVTAGFILTAIPNWTGRLPLSGLPLAGLVALWFAARLAQLFSGFTGPLLPVALDVAFPLTLAAVAAHEVIAAGNRNLPIVAMIGAFALANALDHAEALGMDVTPGLGWRLAFALVLMLIAMIGGRIIPTFTRNWLEKKGVDGNLPAQPDRFDAIALAATAGALLGWAVRSDHQLVGALLVVAGILQAIRLARWSGMSSISDPLVFILHLGFAWLPLGLLLLGGAAFLSWVPLSSALHALSAGAMATMCLAVMTRATLGHTGRDLRAGRSTQALYVMITGGALLRCAAPLLPYDYLMLMTVAGLLWAGAFALFLATFGPMLLRARPDGKP